MPGDLSSLLLDPDDESVKVTAADLARALRGKAAAGAQTQTLGAFGGGLLNYNPAATAQQGSEMQTQAHQGQQDIQGALGERLKMNLQKLTQERELAALQNTMGNQQFERQMKEKEFGIHAAKADKELHPPVPEAEGAKLMSMKSSLPLLDELHQRFQKARELVLSGHGVEAARARAEYNKFADAAISGIAAGAAPAARENAELMKEFRGHFPDPFDPTVNDAAAGVFFDTQRAATQRNLANHTELLGSGPYNRAQVQALGGQGQPAPQKHPQHNEALDWAKKNPKDPRAVAILKKLGLAR